MTDPRRLCDAYYRALAPRPGDPEVLRVALGNIHLPPAPASAFFWERVAEEFDEWEEDTE